MPLRGGSSSCCGNIPSGDGAITHDIFAGGYSMTMMLQFWDDQATPSCGSNLETKKDALQFHLNAMRHDTGRIIWTPDGHPQKILDQVRLSQRGVAGYEGDGGVITTFGFDFISPFPYYINATQICTHVADGATVNFLNNGTADFYPVIHAYGPTSGGFVISNLTTGLDLFYEPALPGARDLTSSESIEFDFFRNTAYVGPKPSSPCTGGGPWTGANMKPGIAVPVSDFFPITVEPLGNNIKIVGTSMDVLWQAAFA